MKKSIELRPLTEDVTNFIPKYATEGAAALDLHAHIKETITLKAQDCRLVPTGIAIHISDPKIAGLILPRSGLGHRHGIILGNTTGVIDSDYQGEIKVSLWNRSAQSFLIQPLDRIAQLIFVPVIRAQFTVVEQFSTSSQRGQSGFGSTGHSRNTDHSSAE